MRSSPLLSFTAVAAFTLAAAGCSSDAPDGKSVTVVPGAVAFPAAPSGATIAVGSEVRRLASDGLTTVADTSSGPMLLGTQVEPLAVWSDDPAHPNWLDSVDAITAIPQSVLVAAAGGLFHTQGNKLLVSPASDEVAGLQIRAMRSQLVNGERLLLLIADSGVFTLRAGGLFAHRISGEAGVPAAALWVGDTLLSAYEGRLYESRGEEATRVALHVNVIATIEPGIDGAAYIATDGGLAERDAAGNYRLLTLADDGGATAASALRYAANEGTYVLIDGGVVLARPNQAPLGVGALESTASALTSDALGQLWIAQGSDVHTWPVGTPVGFANDIAPVLAARCGSCHAAGDNGAPPRDFSDYATSAALVADIVERIDNGNMPPTGSEPLSFDEHALIQRWANSGLNP